MFARATAILTLLSWQVADAEWNPRLAADYLDARQETWFNWPIAKTSTGPCLSCHTGFPYLLARPRLRQLLGESGRTVYEVGLLDAVRKRLAKATPREFLPDRNEPENTGVVIAGGPRLPKAAEELGVESVLATLLLALEDSHSGGGIRPRARHLAIYQMGIRPSAVEYSRAIAAGQLSGLAMARFHQRYDVILGPTLAKPPVPLGILSLSRKDVQGFFSDMPAFHNWAGLFNVTGQPSMSVPLYWTAEGLPIGMMFSARFGDEATLFRLAAQLERARPWAKRRPVV